MIGCVMIALAMLPIALDAAFPLNLARLHDLSVTVRDRQGRPLRIFTNLADKWRLPIGPQDVSPAYLALLQHYEDRRFDDHIGVDLTAVARAVGQNLAAGRVVSGASTLTMQVARLLEPRPRSLWAKLHEMARAVQLDYHYDKQTILGMYLTLAPFGGNLEGVRAASLALFGKPPHALSVGESALLVALPQAPSRLRPDRFPDRARSARDKVLRRALTAGVLDDSTVSRALAEPIPVGRLAMPQTAFHLSARLRIAGKDQIDLATTIDGPLQVALEGVARRAAGPLHPEAALAILVVENETRSVVGYVGSPEPLEHQRLGPIDMVQAVRSPGSALKPFIYGLGFEDRVIHPDTLVADVSTRFGGYAPANFSGGFSGDITVRQALQQSLNVPAVMVLARVGPERLASALRAVGTRLVFPADGGAPGLPMALGGVSVSLWDMVTLYVGLARGGVVAPLRTGPGAPPEGGQRFISETAAWTVVRILEGTPPPPGLVQATEVTVRPAIALKTGTSYGFRDAWAFGVTRGYTAGVWVGRPDGTPSPDRYGRNTAAPLLFQVFDLLPAVALGSAAPPAPTAGAPPPDLLRRLEATLRDDRPIRLADSDPLRLVFPTADIVLELQRADGGFDPLTLQATGGRRPFTWLVNGDPIESRGTRRDAVWQPAGPGFVRVTVIDADGRTAGADLLVR